MTENLERSDQNDFNLSWLLIFACWILTVSATLGSLFFSEVMDYPPCVLCWYQRICTYPLVIILLTGLMPLDIKVVKYSFPITVVGWLIALYHNLLYYKVLPESVAPCTQGVSCTEKYIELFGFVSIPLMSILNYTAILALLIIVYKRGAK